MSLFPLQGQDGKLYIIPNTTSSLSWKHVQTTNLWHELYDIHEISFHSTSLQNIHIITSISMIKYHIYNVWLILCTLNENSCLSLFFDCFCIVKKYNQDALQSNSMVNKIESCALFARLHRSNKKLTRPKSRVSRWLLKNSKMIDFVLLLF